MSSPAEPAGADVTSRHDSSQNLHHEHSVQPECSDDRESKSDHRESQSDHREAQSDKDRAVPQRYTSQESVDRGSRPDRPPSRNKNGAGKRPSIKKGMHSRSQSHNKVPTRMSTSANATKPNLSRSKSTDGIVRTLRPGVKRNNRSYTKLSSLQPLTKTISNSSLNRTLQPLTKNLSRESLKGYGLRKTTSNGSTIGSVVLTKSDSNQSIKSSKSNGSLKGLSLGSHPTGIKTSAKRGRAILNLNEEPGYGDFEDTSGSENEDGHQRQPSQQSRISEQSHLSEQSEHSHHSQQSHHSQSQHNEQEYDYRVAGDIPESLEQPRHSRFSEEVLDSVKSEPEVPSEKDSNSNQNSNQNLSQGNLNSDTVSHNSNSVSHNSNSVSSASNLKNQLLENPEQEFVPQSNTDNSTEDLMSSNLYGGSFLLSQSTGMTRKIEPSNESLSYVSTDGRDSLSRMGSEKSSGIIFKPRAKEDLRSESEPAVTKATVTQGSYQPNQTIFSNLQRNDSQYLSTIKSQRQQTGNNKQPAPTRQLSNKNFSSYLTGSQNAAANNNIETRTQQRLWLQRENSFLDTSANVDPSKVGNFSNLSLNKLMFAHNYNNSTTNMRDMPGSSWGHKQDAGASDPSVASHDNGMNVSSIMYLMQSGHQQSIESRTEFERLNREYVNVRRHLNPVASSLGRVQRYSGKKDLTVQKKSDKKGTYNTSANSFKEFAPSWESRAEETNGVINKLWHEALISSSSSMSLRHLQEQESGSLQGQRRRNMATTPTRSGPSRSGRT